MAQNTISDELNRLIQAKADIKSALEEKGLTIGDSSTLDEYPGLIQEMEVGGGSDTSTLIDLIENDVETLVIPEGATKIGYSGLTNRFNLRELTIPNSLTKIDNYGLNNSSILQTINVNHPLTLLGQYNQFYGMGNTANLTQGTIDLEIVLDPSQGSSKYLNSTFRYAKALRKLKISGSLENNSYLADGCENLEEVDLSELNGLNYSRDSVLGSYSFQNCKKLHKVIFPYNITRIGEYAFLGDSALSGDIFLDEKITSVGRDAFDGCSNLNSIIVLNKTSVVGDYIQCYGQYNYTFPIYVPGSRLDGYKNGSYLYRYGDRIKPLASMSYDASTYTVTALGRDNLELYVDSSLINSSVYTFDSTTQAGNHTVTVKSVDPSLGILDTVSQKITI